MALRLQKTTRLAVAIGISSAFFLIELTFGFLTHSLALKADAFHYFGDLVSFAVALVAAILSGKRSECSRLTFGWQRCEVLGAFFNGVSLFALGMSICLSTIERFVSVQEVKDPTTILIVGGVGFALNVMSAAILHDHPDRPGCATLEDSSGDKVEMSAVSVGQLKSHHDGRPQKSKGIRMQPCSTIHKEQRSDARDRRVGRRDLGIAAVLLHVLFDALNNLIVIVSGTIILTTTSKKRFYADPIASLVISLFIVASAIPVMLQSGRLLLYEVPNCTNIEIVERDLRRLDGVEDVPALHVWRLNQTKTVASVHVVVSRDAAAAHSKGLCERSCPDLDNFQCVASAIVSCLHGYGIHSVTIQPEIEEQPTVGTEGTDEVY